MYLKATLQEHSIAVQDQWIHLKILAAAEVKKGSLLYFNFKKIFICKYDTNHIPYCIMCS